MNIIDYVKWRGDIPFTLDPLNYVDNLIFSQLVYYDVTNAFSENKVLTIGQLSDFYYKNDKKDTSSGLLYLLSKSERFKDIKVYNYVSILNNSPLEQFAAMTLDLPNNVSIIAFRGTDETVTGWHEDFEMSYKEIPSQVDAIKYVNNNMRLFKRYILLGHSKGGNLALYSAVKCKERCRTKIQEIISFDGPGLREGTYGKSIYEEIKNKYIKFVPEYGVVGLLYENDEKRVIVKSDGKGFLQHSVFSWQVEKNRIITSDKFDEESIAVQKSFANFISKTSENQRRYFVKDIFDVLYHSDIYDITEVFSNDKKKLSSIIKNLDSISDDAKDAANILFNEFINQFGNKLRDDINDSFSYVLNEMKNLFKK